MNIFKRYAGHIGRLISSPGLLLHIFRHGCRGVSKGLVFGEFRLICRDKLIAVLYIMYIINGEPAAFLEERTENLSVDSLTGILLVTLLKKLCLQGIMSAQSAVAAADKYVFLPRLPGDLIHGRRNLIVRFRCLLCCKASGISQHIEQIVLLFKPLTDAVLLPIGIYRYIMDRLHACRVVIQHYDLLVICFDFFL